MFFEEDIFEELERMRKRINRLMSYFKFPELESFPVDISETEDEVIIRADLPGFKKDEISLIAREDRVEISAQHKEKKVEQKEHFYRAERRFGALKRIIALPAKVDYSKAEAKFENGVLTVRFPKIEKKKGKKIEIK